MEFIPFNRDGEINKWKRNLPHLEQKGGTYFVTFRLEDSIPKTKLDAWILEKAAWESNHPKPWSASDWDYYRENFLQRIERWSDQGYGACHFRDPGIREIVSNALLYFDSENQTNETRYNMGSFVIMPNHIHLLVQPIGEWKLGQLIHSWKSYSAHQINRKLNRKGSIWMDERFDHLVRNLESMKKFQCYIQKNPLRAGLKPEDYRIKM